MAPLQFFIGIKGDRMFLCAEQGTEAVNQAYLDIGKKLGIHVEDPGNVDLDEFHPLVLKGGDVFEIKGFVEP